MEKMHTFIIILFKYYNFNDVYESVSCDDVSGILRACWPPLHRVLSLPVVRDGEELGCWGLGMGQCSLTRVRRCHVYQKLLDYSGNRSTSPELYS